MNVCIGARDIARYAVAMQQHGSPGSIPRRTRFVYEAGNLASNLMFAAIFLMWALKGLSNSAENRLVAFLAAAGAVGLFCAALGFWCYSRIRIFLSRRAAMRDRTAFAAALLPALRRGGDIEFALFIRPFFVDDVFKWKSRGRFSQDTRSFWQFGGKLDLEESLATAIDQICPLVAMGGASIGPGPPEIRAGATQWQDEIALLIERATLIVAVPFAQPATRWEIEKIVRGRHLEKTIFLIPPLRRRAKLKGTFAGARANAVDVYHDSLREFARIGLELPRIPLGGAILWQEIFSAQWVVNRFRSEYDFEPSRLREILVGRLGTVPRSTHKDWYMSRPGLGL